MYFFFRRVSPPGVDGSLWFPQALIVQWLFFLASLAFDVAQLCLDARVHLWRWAIRAHLDTFYFVMFCIDVGMGQ